MSIYHLLHLSNLLSLLSCHSLPPDITSPLYHNVGSHLDIFLLVAEKGFDVCSFLIEYIHSDMFIDQRLLSI